ncbi:MAG: 30S ribosomal protein S17 [Pseudomonadaceae bacterium]|nr:30S ribosomal protein S17 [Pseudomonadaceae bacterium]
MPRRILQGTVVSTKAAKTIVVRTDTTTKHPVYGKTMRGSKKFHAHDEASTAKLGDVVQIVECPPKSALKRFELLKVVKAAGEQIADSASDVALEETPAPAKAAAQEQPSA